MSLFPVLLGYATRRLRRPCRPPPRLVKSQCTFSSGFSRVMSVTVGPCFKCDRSLVAVTAVSNHGYPSNKAHLFHADIQRVRAQRLRLAIKSRCRHGSFDCVMQKRAGIESLTDHANGPERHLTHAGRKWAEQHRPPLRFHRLAMGHNSGCTNAFRLFFGASDRSH